MKPDIEEIKKNVIYDFIRYKITKDDRFKKSVLEGLKKCQLYYHTGKVIKLPKCDNTDALFAFLEMTKGAKYGIDLIYSNL